MTAMSWLKKLALLAGMAAAPMLACAEVNYRALLIGVSDYPHLKPELRLKGPRNDVLRWHEVLVQRGVPAAAITTLADGVRGAALPTRRNILDQLEILAKTAKPNDYIVITFSGHGSQVPVPPGSPHSASEPDGLFEVFLPRDTKNWTRAVTTVNGEVPNAIYDHEVRALIDRTAATGAFVWVVFDSCHAATMVRAVSNQDSVRLRQVSPAKLGIPSEAIDQARKRAVSNASTTQPQTATGGGRTVYFYASHTAEATPEMTLPVGHPKSQPLGLFSFLVTQVLEGGGSITYRQLYQEVLARYGSVLEARSSPMVAGTNLAESVLGQSGSAVRQWRLVAGEKLTLRAGVLSDLAVGSIVAILPTAISDSSTALGYAKVVRSDLATADLEPVAYGGKPALEQRRLASGAVARLIEPAASLVLTVATNLERCAKPCPFEPALARLRETSRAGASTDKARLPLVWARAGQAAHVTLTAIGRRLWLLPAALQGHAMCTGEAPDKRAVCEAEAERSIASLTAGSGATHHGLSTELDAMLRRVGKVENLLRVSALAIQGETGQVLTSRREVRRQGQLLSDQQLDATCRDASVERMDLAGEARTCLLRDDEVTLTLKNSGNRSLDVTVLYVDSRFGILALYPREGEINRVEPRALLKVPMFKINDDTTGTERVVVIAAEVPNHRAEPVDLSLLSQDSLGSIILTRGRALSPTEALFAQVAFGSSYKARGAISVPVPSRLAAQVFTWHVKR